MTMTEFTEAELLAFDRAYAQAKDSGALQADADRRALNEQNQVDTLQGATC